MQDKQVIEHACLEMAGFLSGNKHSQKPYLNSIMCHSL